MPLPCWLTTIPRSTRIFMAFRAVSGETLKAVAMVERALIFSPTSYQPSAIFFAISTAICW